MEKRVIDLGGVHSARPISYAAYRNACLHLEHLIFGGNWLYDFGPASKDMPPLGETFTYGLYLGEALIGWHFAHQTNERTVYMADTGILPEHQGKGIYKRLLPHLLDVYRAAGFTLVQSHHRATNNRVIIPKLRAGFFIQGLNLYEGGLNVALTCSLDDSYRLAQHVRSGFRQARGEAARRLGLPPLASVFSGQDTSRDVLTVPMPSTPGEALDLGGGYLLHPVSYEVYQGVYTQLEEAAYKTVSFDWQAEALLAAPNFRRYAWLVSKDGLVAGWQYSRQWDARTACMVNTALLPAHRGQGLYSRLLSIILLFLQAQGYWNVRSHHHATNNAVLIPKLRAGFRVQGLEVDEHGVLAVLIHSFNDVYRDYMDVRSGLTRPSGEVASRLGLQAESHANNKAP